MAISTWDCNKAEKRHEEVDVCATLNKVRDDLLGRNTGVKSCRRRGRGSRGKHNGADMMEEQQGQGDRSAI